MVRRRRGSLILGCLVLLVLLTIIGAIIGVLLLGAAFVAGVASS